MPIALLIIVLLMIMLDLRRPYGLPPSERYRQEFMRRRFMRIEIDPELERILDERLREIPKVIQQSFLDSIRIAIQNLLKVGDEET